MTDLKPATQIPPQDWMIAPQTRRIMAVLNKDAEGAPAALFVGGCVRNALLNKNVTDIDIATVHPPDRVTEILTGQGISVIPTGIEHGTVTAVADKQTFEITTLRRDVSTDGRRATVAFTTDWREDAARRDFTMNTLLADEGGAVYDPLGRGLQDLKAGTVIFVGDPARRIAEDYLRILRFFRFHAEIGRGDPDRAALAACAVAADRIRSLSKERMTQEFLKILAVKNPAPVLDLMFGVQAGLIRALCPALTIPGNYEVFCHLQAQEERISVPARLCVLGGETADPSGVIDFLLLPKAILKETRALAACLAQPPSQTMQDVKVLIYRHGRDATVQSILWRAARSAFSEEFLSESLSLAKEWIIPVFPLTGEDLIREGIKPGPDLGKILKEREESWIKSNFDE